MRARSDLIACFSFLILVAQACDSGGERPDLPSTLPGETGGSVSLGGDAGGVDSHVALPFVVDHHFHATGYMGAAVSDDTQEDDPPVVSSDRNQCLRRPEGAQGRCHYFSYAGAAEGWAGLYWLAGYENWGKSPGLLIEPGPTRVRFYAASKPPGLPVQFMVGGVGGVDDPEHPHADTFVRTLLPDLTTTLTPYEIDLTGSEYEQGVLGGFGWVIFSPDPGELFIDDIRWE